MAHLPKSPGLPAGLATMSSDPAAHCALPHSRVLQAQSLAPESVGPPHPVPASAPPLFLPPELGGPWGLTSLHRKRNRSHHLPLPVTSLVTGPSSPRDLRLLLKLRVPCAILGAQAHRHTGLASQISGIAPLLSLLSHQPVSLDSFHPTWTLQPAADPFPFKAHILG